MLFKHLLFGTLLWVAAFQVEPRLPLQVIVVRSSAEADELLEQLKKGTPFGDLARQKSIHHTAAGGGFFGRMRLSDLPAEARTALQGVRPGQITRPFKMPEGYFIIKVLDETEEVEVENAYRSRKLAGTAAGNYRFTPDISGLGQVDGIVGRLPKRSGWEQDLREICEIRQRAVTTGLEQFEQYLAAARLQAPGEKRAQAIVLAHHTLGQLWAYQGDMNKAATHYQAAYEEAIAARAPLEVLLDLEEALGVANLHGADLDNQTNSQLPPCTFPLDPEMRARRPEAAEKAIKHFSKYLERKPDDLELKWLLNLAYMTLGKYPDSVPRKHLLPTKPFESGESTFRYVDVAGPAGLKTFDWAGGTIVDDFDTDGLLDVVTSSMDPCAPMHFFHNNGDGTFEERASQAGLADQLGGLNLAHADYDNNGYLDVYVLRGGWQMPQRNSLLRNNGNGTFTDVTAESGLAIPATASQTAAWADIDNDGYLDLFVGNENAPCQLFLNLGNGKFVDIARRAGVDRIAFTKAITAGDYDNDGFPDFYVSNFLGENFLYRNNRDRTFTDVGRQLGVEKPLLSFPCWFFDYDNDGWLDLFVSSYYTSNVEVLKSYLGQPVQAETMRIYRNTGKGSFEDATASVGLDRVFMPMGANFGDLDGDGFLDFYLGTGSPSLAALLPNALLKNRNGKSFVDVTASSGTGCLHKGHGVAFADLDQDGDQDLFIQVGGAVPSDKHASVLYENPGDQNNWISIRLIGEKTNRAALGARIKITALDKNGRQRFIHRVVTGGGSFGETSFQQNIGLGKAARIAALEIWWPASNTRQIFENPGLNQFIQIRELNQEVVKLERRPFVLGGKARRGTLK